MKFSQISWRKVDAVSAEFAAATEGMVGKGVICVEYPKNSWLRGGWWAEYLHISLLRWRRIVGGVAADFVAPRGVFVD